MANPLSQKYAFYGQSGTLNLHCRETGRTRVYDFWGKFKSEVSGFVPQVAPSPTFPLSLLVYQRHAELFSTEVEYRRVLSLTQSSKVSALLLNTTKWQLCNPLVKEGSVQQKRFRQVIFLYNSDENLLKAISLISDTLRSKNVK